MNSATSAPLQSSRFWTLDALRGLAVLGVVCFHVLISLDAQAHLDHSIFLVSWLKSGGSLGVSLFFVLSGFSIHLSQARKLIAQDKTCPSWKKFFRRRLGRLYPAYLGALGLSLGLNFTWALIRGRDPLAYWPSTWDLLSHLLLLHTLQTDTFFGIIPALWFMGVQAHLYLLYPFFYWLIQHWGIQRALLVTLLCTLAFELLSQNILFPTNVNNRIELVAWMNTPMRWFEWCFGAWVAQQVAQGKRPNLKYGLSIVFLIFFWIYTGSTVKILYEPILSSLIGFLIWCLVSNENRLQPHAVLQPILYLGKISYPVYLLHQIFVPYIHSAISPNLFNAAGLFIVSLGLVIAITLPVAASFHHWLELPLSRLKPQIKP